MRFTKFITLLLATATLTMGCGNEKPVNPPTGGATLEVDHLSLEVNNPITFTLIADNGTDITDQAIIYDKSHDFVEVPNPFTPTADGKYEFYAVAGNIITESIFVTVLPLIPELPTDSDEANTSFKHRILLIDHTGAGCSFCPQMMLALKSVALTDDYHSKYYEAMSHSYNNNDAAMSPAAFTVSGYYGINSYPTVTYNFLYSTTSSFNDAHIMQQIDALWKESADAGIAASASLATSSVVVNAAVKAAVNNEYRVTAWLLEDGIYASQTNATEDWMNTHDNAIRQIASNNPISGIDLGVITAGEKKELAMSLEIPTNAKEWNRDNFKVMVIASAKNDNGKFEVANVAICPVGGSVNYDYK